MREITYYTSPLTLLDVLLLRRSVGEDVEAMAHLVVRRTDLTMEELLELDINDFQAVALKVADATKQSIVLDQLGNQLSETLKM